MLLGGEGRGEVSDERQKGEKDDGIDAVWRAGGYKKGTNGTDGTVAGMTGNTEQETQKTQYCGL